MSYTTVVVDLNDDVAREARLQAAAALASPASGYIVGVAATGTLLDPYRSAGTEATRYQGLRADMLARLWRDNDVAMRDAFARASASIASEQVVIQQESGWALAACGRTSDIILPRPPSLGQDVPKMMASAAEYVLVNAGRPILVMPPGSVLRLDGTVLIAWNAKREAARAVADAMPLLKVATEVVVLEITAGNGTSAEADSQITRWLARHGVNATSVRLQTPASVADALISTAQAQSAALLVAGGYGHSRIGELVGGGTTRTLLWHSPVPLFMSH